MKPDWFDRRPLVVVSLLIILFFWKLTLSSQFTFLDSPDLAYQVLPWYQVQARAWNEGIFPMWDPFQWAGQPLLGQMQPGAAFPLNWPLFLAPLDDGSINLRWVHWHFVLMHLLAALFMYALVRQLARSRYASIIAGFAFACTGYISSTGWPQMINGAIWIPLVFLLFHRLAAASGLSQRKLNGKRAAGRAQGPAPTVLLDTPTPEESPRHSTRERFNRLAYAVLCGGAVGMSFLSGHHQNPFFIVLALGGLFLYFLFEKLRESRGEAARFAGLYVAVAVCAFVVAALQLLPAWEYGSQAYRWVGAPNPLTISQDVPYYVQEDPSLVAVTLLGAIVPHAPTCNSAPLSASCACRWRSMPLRSAGRNAGYGYIPASPWGRWRTVWGHFRSYTAGCTPWFPMRTRRAHPGMRCSFSSSLCLC